MHCLSVFSGAFGTPLLFSLTKNLSLGGGGQKKKLTQTEVSETTAQTSAGTEDRSETTSEYEAGKNGERRQMGDGRKIYTKYIQSLNY